MGVAYRGGLRASSQRLTETRATAFRCTTEPVAKKSKRDRGRTGGAPGAAAGGEGADAPFVLEKAPERLSSPFKAALKGLSPVDPRAKAKANIVKAPSRISASRPPPAISTAADKQEWSRAYSGVTPLDAPERRRVSSAAPEVAAPAARRASSREGSGSEEAARRRLAALVSGGVRFRISRDEDGRVEALRSGGDERKLAGLSKAGIFEVSLDLHGKRAAEVDGLVSRFVRAEHRRGARVVLIVHGKGLHSEEGVGVLDREALRALTEGGAAPFVLAVRTAAANDGGLGALVVRLVERP